MKFVIGSSPGNGENLSSPRARLVRFDAVGRVREGAGDERGRCEGSGDGQRIQESSLIVIADFISVLNCCR